MGDVLEKLLLTRKKDRVKVKIDGLLESMSGNLEVYRVPVLSQEMKELVDVRQPENGHIVRWKQRKSLGETNNE